MAQKTIPPSDIMAVVATIDPDAYTASTVTSDWVKMADFTDIMAIISAGTLGASATLDAKLSQATDGSGSDVKDITGLAITQMTQAGTDQSDTQAIINCSAEDLDVNNDFTHVQLSMTIAVATSDAAGMILGSEPRYGPASDNDLASVGEIIYS